MARRSFVQAVLWFLIALATMAPARADRKVFPTPKIGTNLGVWRLTHDPTIRHHANYHNTQCWSPDGRYVCYTRYGGTRPGNESTATVHLYDTLTDSTQQVGQGQSPRWARLKNWLLYVDYSRSQPRQRTSDIIWVDIVGGKRTVIAPGPGPELLGETDCNDRWLYGALRFRGQDPEFQVIRMNISAEGGYTKLPAVQGGQLLPNPRHPLFFTRQDHRADPFAATRWWYDLDGANQRIAVPTLQQCHMCWIGSGEYMLLGNGLIRGRRWNEPFPSNVHILAGITVGDVSPCGTSGRFVCGDHNVADLRSGDGFTYIDPLSIICFPQSVKDASEIYDADPKGSPDGTKICFVSNYDLENGPVTRITQTPRGTVDRLVVESTAGFPSAGALVVLREVIGYRHTTPTSFEGLTRGLHHTTQVMLATGRKVTSFEARCLTDAQWRGVRQVSPTMRKTIGDENSPLLRQRQTDVYVAIVRKPDRPWLRRLGNAIQVLPGEHHAETRGYQLFKEGQQPLDHLVRPGETIAVQTPGEYRAVAVEWSGLKSEPSNPFLIDRPQTVQALAETPADFTWSTERWSDAARTCKEIVHSYDGVIRREYFTAGTLASAHDLNAAGKAIRRLTYRAGQIALREYYTAADLRISREVFAPEGNITETVRLAADGTTEVEHWWFERGMPVKLVRAGRTYIKRGDRFGRMEGDRFVDTPRGPSSEP
jgi:hypothetical protein